jgi:hypothetical protein
MGKAMFELTGMNEEAKAKEKSPHKHRAAVCVEVRIDQASRLTAIYRLAIVIAWPTKWIDEKCIFGVGSPGLCLLFNVQTSSRVANRFGILLQLARAN